MLHINNGVTINARLASEESCVTKLFDDKTAADEVVHEAYMKALSRPPTPVEQDRLSALLTEAEGDDRRRLIEDLYWSILSSREFLFNH